jgi:hypothetical protein
LKSFFIILLVFSIAGCSKNSEPDDDLSPVIQLTSPSNNQVFTGGQTINIAGSINDNNKLVEVHVHIYNHTSGQQLIDINRFPGSNTYILNETFQVQPGIQYRIQILATDKSANQGSETVLIVAN